MKKPSFSTRQPQELSTAALPDIVFMLLFFFMVTTVMREEAPPLNIERPRAVNVEDIRNKELTATLWVGFRPGENVPSIRLDDRWIEAQEAGKLLAARCAALPEALQAGFVAIIKADASLPMESIVHLKTELRKEQILKIQYSAQQESEDSEGGPEGA